MGIIELIIAILAIAKLMGELSISWWLVFSPALFYLVPIGLSIVGFMGVLFKQLNFIWEA